MADCPSRGIRDAPENTVPGVRLAADQQATFVEFDLRLTKDREIVRLHDDSLERTTDIEDVFPDRFRSVPVPEASPRRWRPGFHARRDPKAGRRLVVRSIVPRHTDSAFAETIDSLRGKSGLFIELKSPERYQGIEKMILAELKAKGLDRPGADPRTPVLLQSFTASGLQILAGLGTKLPVHFLVSAKDAPQWLTPEGLGRVKAFASGLSPERQS